MSSKLNVHSKLLFTWLQAKTIALNVSNTEIAFFKPASQMKNL